MNANYLFLWKPNKDEVINTCIKKMCKIFLVPFLLVFIQHFARHTEKQQQNNPLGNWTAIKEHLNTEAANKQKSKNKVCHFEQLNTLGVCLDTVSHILSQYTIDIYVDWYHIILHLVMTIFCCCCLLIKNKKMMCFSCVI